MPTDRIDQMTHEELKAATRAIWNAWIETGASCGNLVGHKMEKAINALKPSPFDQVREFLTNNGFITLPSSQSVSCQFVDVNTGRRAERWVPCR